jgi:hypothetical protein
VFDQQKPDLVLLVINEEIGHLADAVAVPSPRDRGHRWLAHRPSDRDHPGCTEWRCGSLSSRNRLPG